MIVEVIPFVHLPKSLSYFDYEVPRDLEEQIKIGQLVKIPFKGRQISGLVIKIKSKPEIKKNLKQIIKILDLEPQINLGRLKLLHWLSNYYLVSPSLIAKIFFPEPPKRIGKFKTKQIFIPAPLGIPRSNVSAIQKDLKNFSKSQKKRFLFYYQSQKYKVAFYLKVAEYLLKQNKQVLILESQISNIDLILPYFFYLFSKKIAVLHSGLSKTDYWEEWKKIQTGKAKIVIGTRGAIFAPLDNLGLIIIDDEEMPDFKQSDQYPYYDARIAALKLAKIVNAKIILGSQAPRTETYYGAKNKRFELLSSSFGIIDRPKTLLIDMRQETKRGNFLSLSDELQRHIKRALDKKQKVVLLLNRRGASTLALCRDCGYVFRCNSCESSLICHEDEKGKCDRLVCHHCGYEEEVPAICPKCHGPSIKFFGIGTQKVEREVKNFFPNARVARIDKDVQVKDLKFKIADLDIFVGTQFFIKSYLPQVENIGLIGVISADTLLFRPDFRSGERAFGWLTKIINFGGQFKCPVLIQTFLIDNFFIRSAVNQNYEAFYNHEIEERRGFHYPPFGEIIKLIYQHKNEKKCIFETNNLFKNLIDLFSKEAEIFKNEKPKIGKQKFISTITIKSSASIIQKIINYLKKMPESWAIDVNPEDVL